MNTKHHLIRFILPVVACLVSVGCVRMYTLPDAPPKSEWVAAQEQEEDPDVVMRRFLDSKRAAIQCFAGLADHNWDKALSWMSQNSKDFFENHSNNQGAASAFENGTIWIDGEEMSFDPVGDVFIHDLSDIRDEFAGRIDDESKTRKVLYAVSSSGQAREIVFVLEDEKWVLEKTDISSELLTE